VKAYIEVRPKLSPGAESEKTPVSALQVNKPMFEFGISLLHILSSDPIRSSQLYDLKAIHDETGPKPLATTMPITITNRFVVLKCERQVSVYTSHSI
jgi:hypothetical protein